MLSSDLDFHLPPESIAQTPAEPRDSARLLRLRRDKIGGRLENVLSHHSVSELPALLQPGDLLVFNDTKVLRARLLGRKPTGGQVEALLLREIERNVWEALLKPSARLREGGEVFFGEEGSGVAACLEKRLGETWQIRFLLDGDVRSRLGELGQVPIPPYIRTLPQEAQYQTVYSRSRAGEAHPLDSAAAPTAGLHFTPGLLANLAQRGIETCFLTLGVGAGTFKPVQTETLEEHAMHSEEFEVSAATAARINAQKARGGRVVAVGTTTTRVLESVAAADGTIRPGFGSTNIFIRPGFCFKCVDALMTNFHLPKSTLLALVSTFVECGIKDKAEEDQMDLTGIEIVRYAYANAIATGYRFFSFGDAMLIE